VFWLEPVRHHARFGVGQMPIWIWQDPQLGHFFGTPHLAWPGVKVGKHHSGESVDPDTLNRDVTDDDERPLRQFLERLLPDLAGPVASSRVCLYTNTPDENFIVDRHPRYADVVIAAGFSGHGFKFAGVIGEILADLATGGQATPHADFLKLRTSRFSDPRTQAGAAR
jgi:glycine/D-amino acid oxidase-like deaminating enzyme